jgi:hypothetical protein
VIRRTTVTVHVPRKAAAAAIPAAVRAGMLSKAAAKKALARGQKGDVVLSLSDTSKIAAGVPGFPGFTGWDEALKKLPIKSLRTLYELFHQVGFGLDREQDPSGLGVAVAAEIVRREKEAARRRRLAGRRRREGGED